MSNPNLPHRKRGDVFGSDVGPQSAHGGPIPSLPELFDRAAK